jgi:hypothetical protein
VTISAAVFDVSRISVATIIATFTTDGALRHSTEGGTTTGVDFWVQIAVAVTGSVTVTEKIEWN